MHQALMWRQWADEATLFPAEGLAADPRGATSVSGVWVAGNITDLRAQLIVAAGAGLTAATAINAGLIGEDVRLAVARKI